MKKIFLTFFYIMITIMFSAACFLLPSILNDYQDEQIFSRIEHSSIDPIEFTYSSSLLDTLRLFSSGYFLAEYPITASSRSADDVYQIALDIIKQLKRYQIVIFDDDDAIINYDAYLQLAIASNNTNQQIAITPVTGWNDQGQTDIESSDSETVSKTSASKPDSPEITTAVIWRCSVYSQNGFWVNFKIDDKSGKLVDFSVYSKQTITSAYSQPEIEELVNAVSAFLQDNYQLPAEPILQKMEKTSSAIFDKQPYITETDYTIQFKEESGNLLQIPLRIHANYLVMNNLYE